MKILWACMNSPHQAIVRGGGQWNKSILLISLMLRIRRFPFCLIPLSWQPVFVGLRPRTTLAPTVVVAQACHGTQKRQGEDGSEQGRGLQGSNRRRCHSRDWRGPIVPTARCDDNAGQ
jgi:hypothetical protein